MNLKDIHYAFLYGKKFSKYICFACGEFATCIKTKGGTLMTRVASGEPKPETRCFFQPEIRNPTRGILGQPDPKPGCFDQKFWIFGPKFCKKLVKNLKNFAKFLQFLWFFLKNFAPAAPIFRQNPFVMSQNLKIFRLRRYFLSIPLLLSFKFQKIFACGANFSSSPL